MTTSPLCESARDPLGVPRALRHHGHGPSQRAIPTGLIAALAVIGVCLAIGILSTVQPVVAIIVTLGVGLAVTMASLGLERFVTAMGLLAAFTLSWNGIRVPGAPLTVGDVPLLALGAAVFILPRRPATTAKGKWMLRGSVLIVCGAVIGSVFAADRMGALGFAIVRSMPVVLTLLIVRRWNPGPQLVALAMRAFVLGVTVSAAAGVSIVRPNNGRAYGLTHHPNQLAADCIMALGITVVVLLWGTQQSKRVYWICAPILMYGLLESGSRAGVLALGGVAFAVAFRAWKLGWRAAQIGGVVLIGALLVGGVIGIPRAKAIDRLYLEESPRSDAERYENLSAEINRSLDHPFTGSGILASDRAHNIYLEVIGSAGLIGIAGLLVLIGNCVRGAFVNVPISLRDPGRFLKYALSVAFVGFAFHEAFQNAVWNRWPWFMAGLFIALEAHTSSERPEAVTATRSSRRRAGTLRRPAPELRPLLPAGAGRSRSAPR